VSHAPDLVTYAANSYSLVTPMIPATVWCKCPIIEKIDDNNFVWKEQIELVLGSQAL